MRPHHRQLILNMAFARLRENVHKNLSGRLVTRFIQNKAKLREAERDLTTACEKLGVPETEAPLLRDQERLAFSSPVKATTEESHKMEYFDALIQYHEIR